MNEKKDEIAEDEIDLREILGIFIKRKWWFLGTVAAILLVGLVFVFLQPANYKASYRFAVRGDYLNNDLSNSYPNRAEQLNYYTMDKISELFASMETESSMVPSDSVQINRLGDTNIFELSTTDPDPDIAREKGLVLIESFQGYMGQRAEEALDEVKSIIINDIEDFEDRIRIIRSERIPKLKDEVDVLYEDLDSYIVDYNINITRQLEETREGNIGFYNVVIPPNKISDSINLLNNDISFYRGELIGYENESLMLRRLYNNLLKDESLIVERVKWHTGTPFVEAENNIRRNLLVVLALSLIGGVVMVFVVNFASNIRKRRE